MKKILAFIFCFIIIFSFNEVCFAQTINYGSAKSLGKTTNTYAKEMWYDNKTGIWTFDNDDGSQTEVSAAVMSGPAKIGDYLKSNGFTFMVPLTPNAQAAYNEGDYITFDVEASTLPLANLFDTTSFYGSISNGYLYLHANPIMKNFGVIKMGNFVSGLNVSLPIVDITYGNNLYKIYKSSRLQGIAVGKYQIGETRITVIDNYMHPAMIKSYSGQLNTAYQIRIGDDEPITPKSLNVGYNSFRNGGDLGYRFFYPFTVSFTGYKYEAEIIPPEPTAPEPPNQPETSIENEEAAILAAASKWKLHRVK